METIIVAGKGGTGKTISATAMAVLLAQKGEKTAVIDYDGGHSVAHTLGIESVIIPNTIHAVDPTGLSVIIIESPPYKNIIESKEAKMSLDEYLAQFPDNLGIIPFADMLHQFFGLPIDVTAVEKFMVLTTIISLLNKEGFANVIIDVEPTAGLQRLLEKADESQRSIYNLSTKGRRLLTVLGVLGARWSDIASYLSGAYLKNMGEYSTDIEFVVATMRSAVYFLVCTPEAGPVEQTKVIRSIIEKFGGRIHGYIINNVRGEVYEQKNIDLIRSTGLPVRIVSHCNELHTSKTDRIYLLRNIGELLIS